MKTLTSVVNCILFCKFCLFWQYIFYGTWPTGKCTGKLTHRCVIIRMVLTRTSFCVLKFMSPACRPYFADDARLVYMHHPKLKSKHIHSCLGKLCLLTYLLTYLPPCSRVLLANLTGSQLAKNFPAFYGTRSFVTATCPYPEPDQFSQCPHIPLRKDPS